MILAIETSCDETAAAVIGPGPQVLSNTLSSQIKTHQATGGIVPEVASRLQLETIIPVLERSFDEAGATWDDVDRIAVTVGPGLIGPLLVGVETAKALAYARDLPLVPVNHLAGHLYAALQRVKSIDFPYFGLIVSGGHTELVEMRGHHDFRLLGSTRDDAAGEAFDKVGRLLGFGYPGGPAITKLAESGDPTAIAFPRAMLNQDNLDFSFSGLKTAVLHEADKERLIDQRKADIAASFQAAVVDVLVNKTLRAAEQIQPKAILLGGGVAANPLLRTTLSNHAATGGYEVLVTPFDLATDNAAMIGLAAFYQGGTASPLDLSADPNLPLATV